MSAVEIFTIVASSATAIGVFFVAWQLWITIKQNQATFEDSFDQQYRNLSLPIPVDVFLGKELPEEDHKKIRELIFNYCDLSNEQIFLRSRGRISRKTWHIWRSGMQSNFKNEAFMNVYLEVKESSRFTYLDKLIASNFTLDPRYD